jgi:addiction module HigA family antidote
VKAMARKEYPMGPILVAPTHPGVLFGDLLSELDGGRRTKGEIAALLKVSRQTLYRVLEGKTAVTADMAIRLGKLCGNGPELWLNMQARFDAWEAAQKLGKEIDEIPTLS